MHTPDNIADEHVLCSPDEVLLALHVLGNLKAPLSEACRDNLAAALKRKFSSVQLEVASPTSGVSQPPILYLGSMMLCQQLSHRWRMKSHSSKTGILSKSLIYGQCQLIRVHCFICLDSQVRITIASKGSALQNFTMLIRAMRRLRLTPPRSWLEAAGTDLINRVVQLLTVCILQFWQAYNAEAYALGGIFLQDCMMLTPLCLKL